MLNKFYKNVRIVYQDGQECEGSERQIQSAKFPFYIWEPARKERKCFKHQIQFVDLKSYLSRL